MMRLEQHVPDSRLSRFVRRYEARTADLADAAVRIALPARPEVILEFYFATPHLIEVQQTGGRERAPWAVAVGPQTFRRVDLILSGRIDVFTVHFMPTGLHALFGIPMPELTNAAIEAEHLLGAMAARVLHEQLAEADGLAARACLMDAALLARVDRARPDLAAWAVERLQRSDGAASVAALARDWGGSERQFRRLFLAQVGAPPKLYARIVRLHAALAARSADPDAPWTDIAHRFGWFDQAHLDKDFQALAGASPTRFLHHGAPSPA